MANLKTWDCKSVVVYVEESGNSDVVYNVNWTVNCVSDVAKPDGEFYKSRIYGSQSIPAPEEGTFIPFKDLTNAIVEGWTKAALGDETVAELYIKLDAQIEAKINPTSLNMLIPGPVSK
tara:strand:- start:38 stop:394 length:357 start_codon:yes stop_codon:yes gene_type:complete